MPASRHANSKTTVNFSCFACSTMHRVGESSGPSLCTHRDSHKPADPERRSTLSKMTCAVQLTEHLLKTLPIDAHSCSIPILLLGPQPRGWVFLFVCFIFCCLIINERSNSITSPILTVNSDDNK